MASKEEIREKVVRDIIEVCGSEHRGGLVSNSECRGYSYKYKGNSCRYCITDQIFKYLHDNDVVIATTPFKSLEGCCIAKLEPLI